MIKFGVCSILLAFATYPVAAQDTAASQGDAYREGEVRPVAPSAVPSMIGPVRVGPTLNIPDEIASAVMPYLICRQTAAGVPIRINGKVEISTEGKNCAVVRDRARKEAARVLEHSKSELDRAGKAAFIEKTLVSIEEFSRPRTEQEMLEALSAAERQQ